MRRILLDQGLSPAAASLLNSDGWDALHVADAGLDRAEDIQILEFARRDNRACVTLDHDFHAHLALAQMAGPSVVLVRLERLDASDQAALIRRVWEMCADAIVAGAAVSVDAVSVRIRKLPLRRSEWQMPFIMHGYDVVESPQPIELMPAHMDCVVSNLKLTLATIVNTQEWRP